MKTAAYASVAFNSVTGLWENDNIHDMMYNILNGCYDPPPEDDDAGMHAHLNGDDGPASPLRQPRRGDRAARDDRQSDDGRAKDDSRRDDGRDGRDDPGRRDDSGDGPQDDRLDDDAATPAAAEPKYSVVETVSRHIVEFDKVLQDPLVRHHRAYLVMAAIIPILATAFYVYKNAIYTLMGSTAE